MHDEDGDRPTETDGDEQAKQAPGREVDHGDEGSEELPEPVVEEAERLTRLARAAVDEAEAEAYRTERADLLADHEFAARVREDDETLVLYPTAWLADGVVRVERVEDTDRAHEVSLSGAGDPDDWAAVESHNAALVEAVAEEHGPVHGANARAFADFMGNHYARRVETASAAEVREFLEEYFPRNAWPSTEQREVVAASVRYVFEAADEPVPL